MPGHGASPPITREVQIEWLAERILGELDRLRLDEVVLVGLSMGGGIAQYVTLAAPDRVRGLVLVSTSPSFPEATRRRFRDRAEIAERDGMTAVVEITVPRWFTAAFSDAHPDVVEAVRETVRAVDPASFGRASRANADRDCSARLGEIGCPVLFVGGLDDPADPQRAVGLYRASIRDLSVELLPDASHLVPIEAPDRVVPILERFLDGLPAR